MAILFLYLKSGKKNASAFIILFYKGLLLRRLIVFVNSVTKSLKLGLSRLIINAA